ncbi:MAG: RNA polymerase sigma factor [Candidatus Spechtbacterales bacterium]|nr:RNA polymerase sigma factor [Candidatus Spechtbacterales bacterium]
MESIKELKIEFIKLYDQHHAGIYRFIRFKVPTLDIAQDLAAETYTRAWDYLSRNLDKYPKNPRAYLYKTARNLVADHYKSAKVRREFNVEEDEVLEYLDKGENSDIEDNLDIRTNMKLVQKCLQDMDSQNAELITLRYIEEFSNTEIAQITGKTEVAVRVGISRGLKELREKMEKQDSS